MNHLIWFVSSRYYFWLQHKKAIQTHLSLHKKWSFLLRISSVNVTKSAWNCRFGQIYCRNPWSKTSFFVQWIWIIKRFLEKLRTYLVWNTQHRECRLGLRINTWGLPHLAIVAVERNSDNFLNKNRNKMYSTSLIPSCFSAHVNFMVKS